MGLKKCPKCELNYISENEKYCEVCKRALKGESDSDDTPALCLECGEHPAIQGLDICTFCLRERRREAILAKQEAVDIDDIDDIDVIDADDEIVSALEDDIPESELEVMGRELGIDDDFSVDDEDVKLDLDDELPIEVNDELLFEDFNSDEYEYEEDEAD